MDFADSDSDKEKGPNLDFLKQVKIRFTDFSLELQSKAIAYAGEGISKTRSDKEAGSYLKEKVDTDPDFHLGVDGAWQVIVGRSFAAAITHETSSAMFFDILGARRTVLMFKTQ
mmetsp:Transcript_32213/g.55699  ORF Transcript_32213/g.55699 Transcript_32213/m.55699 type:complete len:114 (+) Transcript_32213:2056-2397(+)